MIGTRIAHYEITAKLGEGGMGEVYRATDTKLNRDVALKILPEQFASDGQRMGRFQREAEVLASLDHPNIGAIHGIEDVGETKALVLQLIEGPTLADRIAEGPTLIDEALPIALQITEALEAAHEKGIIHRDLKPANIKITPDGQVKVLDFGLAKALENDPTSSPDMTQSPTLSMAATRAGLILGTAAYMSPEQAKGKATDRRSDVWAFGAVLYEMLTGRQAFGGDDVSEVMAAVIMKPPSLEELPSDVPPAIRDLLERCLRKDLTMRLPDVAAARIAMQEYLANPTAETAVPTTETLSQPGWQRWVPWAVAGVLAVVVLAGFVLWPQPAAPPLRKLSLAGTEGVLAPQISPDGKRLVYGKEGSLWVRELDQLQDRRIEGTEGVFFGAGVWSPDSQQLAFFLGNGVWKIDVDSGNSSIVCERSRFPRALSWGENGLINFVVGRGTSELYEVTETGGDPRKLTEYDAGGIVRGSIDALPGNRGILLSRFDSSSVDVFVGGETRTILTLEGAILTDPAYSPTGHILYVRSQTNPGLYAVPFSLEELKVTGDPILVEDDGGRPSVSTDGTLVYLPGIDTAGSTRQLVWVSREGEIEGTIGQPQVGLAAPTLSPDETRVAVNADENQEAEIWLHDVTRATKTRVTFEGTADVPVWHPDGERIAYRRRSGEKPKILITKADGSTQPEELSAGVLARFSSDGQTLVVTDRSEDTQLDLFYLPLGEKSERQEFLASMNDESDGVLSPDGRWLAYESDESQTVEIYIKRFPSAEGKWQASVNSGYGPLWSKSGDELFFWERGDLMVVGVEASENSLTLSRPMSLFSRQDSSLRVGNNYDISADGARFVMIQEGVAPDAEEDATPPTVVLVENWFAEFKDRQ